MRHTFEMHKGLFSSLKVDKLFHKGPGSKYVKLLSHRVSITIPQLRCCDTATAIDSM